MPAPFKSPIQFLPISTERGRGEKSVTLTPLAEVIRPFFANNSMGYSSILQLRDTVILQYLSITILRIPYYMLSTTGRQRPMC